MGSVIASQHSANRKDPKNLMLEWTHSKCKLCPPGKEPDKDCEGFPTSLDHLNMASAAYWEYSEADGTDLPTFFQDVVLLMRHHGFETEDLKELIEAVPRDMIWTGGGKPIRNRNRIPKVLEAPCKTVQEFDAAVEETIQRFMKSADTTRFVAVASLLGGLMISCQQDGGSDPPEAFFLEALELGRVHLKYHLEKQARETAKKSQLEALNDDDIPF
jgi:hypothetical protein